MDQRSSATAEHSIGEPAVVQQRRVVPANPFVPFERAEVEQSIGDRFEKQVRQYPDRLALKSATHHLTYTELNRAVNRVGRTILTTNGREPGIVALLLETEAPLIIAMLGALKAGRPYVPLDPYFPEERNRYILKDCQAAVLVTNTMNQKLARQWVTSGIELLNLDELDLSADAKDLQQPVRPEALAYILYTSGSTGQPKGVMQTHRNMLHNVMKYTNGVRLSAEDRLSLLTSCGFASSVSDIYGALLNGAAVFPFAVREHGLEELARWLTREAITVYDSVPSLFRSLARTLAGDETFPHLRLIKLAGDRVLKSDVDLYKRHFPSTCIFHVGYGATEMNIMRMYFMNKETPLKGSTVPVGYEVEDTKVLLLDESRRELRAGEVGEIAIQCRFLAVGYWRRPKLTQEAFLPDPMGGGRTGLSYWRFGADA